MQGQDDSRSFQYVLMFVSFPPTQDKKGDLIEPEGEEPKVKSQLLLHIPTQYLTSNHTY